jgi:hypothetical protein
MIADVGTVEAGDDQPVFGDTELRQDIGPGSGVGGSGQRQPRNAGAGIQKRAKKPVIGTEIVAPFADAMRFVDCDQRKRDIGDQPPERTRRRPLGSNVKEVENTRAEALDGLLAVAVRRGQRRRSNAARSGRPDLVVHQCDQRRDDESGSFPGERRKLIAKRFTRTGRHHRQAMLAPHHPGDDLLLSASEGAEAEHALQYVCRVTGHSAACAACAASWAERSSAWRVHSSA